MEISYREYNINDFEKDLEKILPNNLRIVERSSGIWYIKEFNRDYLGLKFETCGSLIRINVRLSEHLGLAKKIGELWEKNYIDYKGFNVGRAEIRCQWLCPISQRNINPSRRNP